MVIPLVQMARNIGVFTWKLFFTFPLKEESYDYLRLVEISMVICLVYSE